MSEPINCVVPHIKLRQRILRSATNPEVKKFYYFILLISHINANCHNLKMQFIKSSVGLVVVAIIGKMIHSFLADNKQPIGQGGFAAPGWIQVARTFK